MKREIFGQPMWLWGIGAAVVIGGYLWIRHAQSAGQSGQGTGTATTPQSQSSFSEWIKQHQSGPSTTPGPTPPPSTPPPDIGPERKWLIHKTGSQHPWSFLRQHHERIVVGPDGSRKIVGA